MRIVLTFFVLMTAAVLALASAPAARAQLYLEAGGAQARLEMASMRTKAYQTVVRQQYDFSCGSAALATLLTYHYDRPQSEAGAFKAMWEVGDQARIRQRGFSLFEMKSYLNSIGLQADGFAISVDKLEEIAIPGIALIQDKGYLHFVVVKGVSSRRVLVGDPAKGLRTIKRKRFEEIWDGTILFVRSDVARGKANFNKIDDWRLAPGSPYDRALDVEGLQASTLEQTRPSFSGFAIQAVLDSAQAGYP